MNRARVSLALPAACVLLFAAGMIVALTMIMTGCASVPPKPCPVTLEASYTAELVEACADAGSMAACRSTPAYAEVKARHNQEQRDAGCRK